MGVWCLESDVQCFVSGCVEDLYWYAQTLYHTGQYHRAVHLLRSRKVDMVSQYTVIILQHKVDMVS